MDTPKLDKPGAGLPFGQRMFVRFYLGPFVSRRSDWDANRRTYERISGKILKLAESVDEGSFDEKVLVSPTRGLEDSSRFWSVSMTLEHLLIVENGIKGLIIALSKGSSPGHKVDIAKLKPLGGRSRAEILSAYREHREALGKELDQSVQNRKSPATHLHPWFGPITAHQWHWLLGAHASIHYQQLKKIVAGLNQSPN